MSKGQYKLCPACQDGYIREPKNRVCNKCVRHGTVTVNLINMGIIAIIPKGANRRKSGLVLPTDADFQGVLHAEKKKT